MKFGEPYYAIGAGLLSCPHVALLAKLDPWLYRYPFEGASARRYARLERCGFGDLDERLLRSWDEELRRARRFVDIGCGPGILTARVAREYPELAVLGVEPSRDYTRAAAEFELVRACAEALPLRDDSVDVAVMLSSIRHVRDRVHCLAELRRVLGPEGVAYVVELDPTAEPTRIRAHTRRLRSRWSRLTFAPLVVRTAPPVQAIETLARGAGFSAVSWRSDPQQPVYIMRLRP